VSGPDRSLGAGRGGWLADERGALAAERILDAAGALFVERGVAGTGMGDVARAAGCSRATLYRYFESRDELRSAYVHRAARRIGAAVAAEVASAGLTVPGERLVAAVLATLDRVRRDPTVAVWFTPGDGALASSMARSSAVIEAMVAAFLAPAAAGGDGAGGDGAGGDGAGGDGAGGDGAGGDAAGGPAGGDVAERARWLVRVVVSLLAQPEADPAAERRLLERFVAPVVVGAGARPDDRR
jgi:AcrR family transcriptional regulator